MIRTYVESILTLHRSGTPIEDILSAVQRILEKSGRRTLYKKILKQTLAALEQEHKRNTPYIQSATGSTLTEQRAEIESIIRELGGTAAPVEEQDDSLIGGFTVTYNNTIVDQSYKRKLLTVYESLTE